MSDNVEHDWHDFDMQHGYEVKCERVADGHVWKVRDAERNVTVLSAEEFEQLRTAGPNPRGLF